MRSFQCGNYYRVFYIDSDIERTIKGESFYERICCFTVRYFFFYFFFSELERCSQIRIVYVPSHLFHMLFELFKNSMRAIMEHHSSSEEYPAIEVIVSRGEEDICVKVRFTNHF